MKNWLLFRWTMRGGLLCLLALVIGWAVFIVTLPPPIQSAEKADAIIVLTGSDRRVERGFKLLTANIAPRMFISGVYDKATRDHVFATFSELDKQLYRDNKNRIDLGYEAENTAGNAMEAARWLAAQPNEIKRVRIVTARYHMPRALREFRRTMPDVELVPDPALPSPFNKDGWWWTRHGLTRVTLEYFKLLYSYVRPLLPSILHLERIPSGLRWDKHLYKD